MYAGALGEYVFADNRFVGRHNHSRERFHDVTHLVYLLLVDAGFLFQHVVHNRHNARQWGVAGSFAKPVDGAVQTFHSHQPGGKRVACGKVIVVVGMEIEVQVGIACHHSFAILIHLVGVEYTKRVGQHKPLDGQMPQTVNHAVDIIG